MHSLVEVQAVVESAKTAPGSLTISYYWAKRMTERAIAAYDAKQTLLGYLTQARILVLQGQYGSAESLLLTNLREFTYGDYPELRRDAMLVLAECFDAKFGGQEAAVMYRLAAKKIKVQ